MKLADLLAECSKATRTRYYAELRVWTEGHRKMLSDAQRKYLLKQVMHARRVDRATLENLA